MKLFYSKRFWSKRCTVLQ